MVSKLIVSEISFLLASTEIAFSNAIFFTILLHSVYLSLASLSLGLTLVTCYKSKGLHNVY